MKKIIIILFMLATQQVYASKTDIDQGGCYAVLLARLDNKMVLSNDQINFFVNMQKRADKTVTKAITCTPSPTSEAELRSCAKRNLTESDADFAIETHLSLMRLKRMFHLRHPENNTIYHENAYNAYCLPFKLKTK